MTPAAKRYTFAFLGFMAAYSAAVIGVVYLDRAFDFPTAVRVCLALLPIVPALFALREFIIFLGAMDEVQRRIQHEAILIAAGVVGFGTFTLGFLDAVVDVPEFSLTWILPAIIAVWGVSIPLVSRRYQ